MGSGRTQRRRRQSPKRSCEASLFPLPWASRGGHPGREPLRNRSPSPTALRTLGPILAFLLRLLHLGLDSGCCGEDVPPPGRGKKEEKMKKYRRALALVSCLSLCSLVWLPSWHVCCKESSSASTSYYSQDDNCAIGSEDTQFQKKNEREEPSNAELSGKSNSYLTISPEGNKIKDDYTVDVQDLETTKLSLPVVEALPTVDLHEESSSVVVGSETIENSSSSSTSERTPVSELDEVEKSGTLSIAKPGEVEQPEADCDAGEAPDADAPVEQPAFVSPPESLVGQHIENVSSSHGKEKVTKSEFESKVSVSEQDGGDPKSALNTSDTLKNEGTTEC